MNILITIKVLEEDQPYFDNLKGHNVIWRTHDDVTADDVRIADVILGNVDLDLLYSAENLKYIHWEYAGSDAVADHPIIKNKILLTNSTGCYSLSIAEHMLGMALHFYKNHDKYIINQEQHIFKQMGEARSILGSRVLVLGCGSIGKAFAEKMHALGAEVVGVKRTPGEKPDYLKALYTADHIDELLGQFDIVALTLPNSEETYHLMNRERLAKLKDGALLINVGRGTAIDTDALVAELSSGRIQAALDVYEQEPLPADHPLWDMKNVLMLPHATGHTNLWYTREKLRELAIRNLEAFLTWGELQNVVDFQTGYKKSNS